MESLHSKYLIPEGKGGSSTVRMVDVKEIRDGVIVLNNKSLRAVLAVSSINFDLKSTDEQDVIIGQYQNLLNSLDFPIQVLIHSRRLNIEPYLAKIKELSSIQHNELIRRQVEEYQNFIRNLTDVTNIMSKHFYIVVPFFPIETQKKNILKGIGSAFNKSADYQYRREMFETQKNQLFQRVDHIVAGLKSTGLIIVMLNTEEVIELLYNSYNPNIFSEEIINNIETIELKNY